MQCVALLHLSLRRQYTWALSLLREKSLILVGMGTPLTNGYTCKAQHVCYLPRSSSKRQMLLTAVLTPFLRPNSPFSRGRAISCSRSLFTASSARLPLADSPRHSRHSELSARKGAAEGKNDTSSRHTRLSTIWRCVHFGREEITVTSQYGGVVVLVSGNVYLYILSKCGRDDGARLP